MKKLLALFGAIGVLVLVIAGTSQGQVQSPPLTIPYRVYKTTVLFSAFACNAVTCDVTIRTLPAKTVVAQAFVDVTQAFACTNTAAAQTIGVVQGTGIYTRSAGDFVADGFVLGQTVTFAGFVNGGDNGAKVLTGVTTTTLTTATAGLVTEAGTGDETVSTCTTATLSMTFGKTAGGAEYIASLDADAAAAVFGDAQVELGANLKTATPPTTPIGDFASWTTTTTAQVRFTSGTGSVGNGSVSALKAGSATIYLVTVQF